MTKTQIMKAREKASKKFEVALKIRELLDEARKDYGVTEWDDEDMECQVMELVCEE